jgi:hypothetical protein
MTFHVFCNTKGKVTDRYILQKKFYLFLTFFCFLRECYSPCLTKGLAIDPHILVKNICIMSQTCQKCPSLTINRPAFSFGLPKFGMFQYTFVILSRTNVTKFRPV